MTISILIKGGTLFDPAAGVERVCDLRLVQGQVAEIAATLERQGQEETLDARGLWIAPGFIDMHTHLRDFGQSDREDIDSGTMAAAAGGYTTVLAMANTEPPVDSAATLSLLLRKISSRARIEVLPVACATRSMKGVELTNMVELAEMGAAGFSDDGMPIANLAVLRRALEYARLCDRLIISHAEDRDLSGAGAMHEGFVSTQLGLPGIPAAAEAAAVAAEIETVRETGGRLHFAHISTAASVALIGAAKASGLAVTADTTPHHIALSVGDMKPYDASFKMNPPLRPEADRQAVVAGLADGTIDAIATDHAPHTSLDKSRAFDDAPFGVIGLETAFPVTLQELVKTGRVSSLQYLALLTTRPAELLGLPEPSIRPGSTATLTIVDPNHTWVYDPHRGYSRSRNSPFSGRRLTGKTLATIYKGAIVYKDEELVPPRLNSAFATA